MNIEYIVDDPVKRKGSKVCINNAGTYNYIHKHEVMGKIEPEQVLLYRMLGLSDADIKKIVQFLRN